MALTAVALMAAPSALGACSGYGSSSGPVQVQQAIDAMQNATSYHVVVSALASESPNSSNRVEVDFDAPDNYHAVSYDGASTNEQVWFGGTIYIRDCNKQICDQWRVISRPSTLSAFTQIAGFPSLPLLALENIRSADVSESANQIELSGDFSLLSAFGATCIDTTYQADASPAVSPFRCAKSVQPTDAWDARFDIWLNRDDMMFNGAIIYGVDNADLQYEFSKYGEVRVDAPPTSSY